MSRTIAIALAVFTAIASQTGAEEAWSLKGNVAETCCCQPACPCVFNSTPTLGHCEGNTLFEIEEGQYGDVAVDGIDVVMAYRFGEWVRLYVDEEATDAQVDAVAELLNQPTTFGEFFAGDAKLLSVEKADVTVKRTPTTIAFSVPDGASEMEVMAGPGGEPVRIENLSVPYFANGYTQYKTATVTHERDGVEFEYSGTNGATSHVEATGTIDRD